MIEEGRNLNEQCALALGWIVIRARAKLLDTHDYWYPGKTHRHCQYAPPQFDSDPAMARLLEDEIERRGKDAEYIWFLCKELGIPKGGAAVSLDHLFILVRATPEQRARAFLEATRG